MKKLLILIFTISFVINAHSQQPTSLLKGAVFNDTIKVDGITITNKSLKQSTATNSIGVFQIPIRLNDTIEVSAIHINNKTIIVNKEIYNKKEIGIEVSSNINEMDELVLNSLLTKSALNFSAALKPAKYKDAFAMQKNELAAMANTDPTKRYGPAGDVNWLSGVTNFFADKKRKKNSEKLNKLRKWDNFKEDFIQDYGMSFFTNQLKISEMIVDEFLIYCRRKKDIATMYANGHELELIDFFVKQSIEYKKKYNID